MSVPIYILTTSGEWFRLNELHGDGWCLTFTGDSGPQMLIRRRAGERPLRACVRASFILWDQGISFVPHGLPIQRTPDSVCFSIILTRPVHRSAIPQGIKPARFSAPSLLLHFGDHEAAERFAAESGVSS